MMAVYVNTVAGTPDFASLPAGKIVDYPFEPRDYRPFAQAQFALSPDALWARLTAFEAAPEERSALELALEGGLCYTLEAPRPDSPREGALEAAVPAHYTRVFGEDLQGIYWGFTLRLPRAKLEALIGRRLEAGGTLEANVFKVCRGGEHDHFGCLFPASPGERPLGGLRIVGY